VGARRSRKRRRARAAGYRSGFEQTVAEQAKADGLKLAYEAERIQYTGKPRSYTPDFKLKNGIFVETKGRFTSADRSKHLRIKEQRPDVEVRFVFQVNNPLYKGSKKRYSDWCEQYGFVYAIGSIPKEWANERVGPERSGSTSGGS
jgi:hypothetical protein